MDVREKLEVIAHLGDHITYKEDIGICYDSALAKVIEDAYLTLKNGVTVQENCKACAEATQNCIVKLQEQIAELRSVQELDGCIRCKDSQQMTVTISNKLVDGVNTGWLGGNLPARFCPFCGRRLPQPPKGD